MNKNMCILLALGCLLVRCHASLAMEEKDSQTKSCLDLSKGKISKINCWEYFKDKKNVQKLDLSNNNIQNPPVNFFMLTSLTHLFLNNNRLIFFPSDYGDFESLTHLFLQNNQLREVSCYILKLKNLKKLDVSNNKITTISRDLTTMFKLKKLLVDGNPFYPSIPAVFFYLRSPKRLSENNEVDLGEDYNKQVHDYFSISDRCNLCKQPYPGSCNFIVCDNCKESNYPKESFDNLFVSRTVEQTDLEIKQKQFEKEYKRDVQYHYDASIEWGESEDMHTMSDAIYKARIKARAQKRFPKNVDEIDQEMRYRADVKSAYNVSVKLTRMYVAIRNAMHSAKNKAIQQGRLPKNVDEINEKIRSDGPKALCNR